LEPQIPSFFSTIDKVSKAYDGDPSSALLEALDPEQNSAFLDHYLDLPFDLSKVLFICTANSLDTVPKPLLDRMEIIRLHGYFLEEKLEIAKRHLIPGLISENGLSADRVEITDEILRKLIGSYSREAGVRSLKRSLDKVFRKIAYKVAKGDTGLIRVDPEALESFIGKPKFHSDRLYEETPPGVVTGLAWNTMGGSLIWIETVTLNLTTAKSAKLEITGKLGDVMKESTSIALTFSKNFVRKIQPDNAFFEKANLHMHFPEGGIPKDGPSAGCAIVTSFVSLALSRPVMPNLAMTGEISLTGLVLPVGGIREKLMAAKRSGIKTLILPLLNTRDFDELPDALKEGFRVHFASTYEDVFPIAFPPRSSL